MRNHDVSPARVAVHPHGRGDNDFWRCPSCRVTGSPPRAWGQLDRHNPKQPPVRFTPTGVGTIDSLAAHTLLLTVHPHGRGDNLAVADRVALADGSPPRAWGQSQQT